MSIRPRIREYMDEYKRENCCIDCGERNVEALQFDHRDPSIKIDTVTKLANSASLEAVMKEIDKCDVRCANCHQIKTKGQQ